MGNKPTDGSMRLANAICELTWSEMIEFTTQIVGEIKHLREGDYFDRHSVAQVLRNIAADYLRKHEKAEQEPAD